MSGLVNVIYKIFKVFIILNMVLELGDHQTNFNK